MSQWLRALVTFAEDWVSEAISHIVVHSDLSLQFQGRSDAFLTSVGTRHAHTVYTHMQAKTLIHIKYASKMKLKFSKLWNILFSHIKRKQKIMAHYYVTSFTNCA